MFYQCHRGPHDFSKLKAEYYYCEGKVDLRFGHCVQLIFPCSETQYQVLGAIALHYAVVLFFWVCHTLGDRKEDRIFLLRSKFWGSSGYFSKLQCKLKLKQLRTLFHLQISVCSCTGCVTSWWVLMFDTQQISYFFLILVFLISFLLSVSLHPYYPCSKLSHISFQSEESFVLFQVVVPGFFLTPRTQTHICLFGDEFRTRLDWGSWEESSLLW